MKVLCSRDSLREALSVIATSMPSRTTKPILEAVLLEASGQTLTLTATDLEVAIRYSLPDVQVEAPGSCLVPAREAADFVRDLTDGTISLETSKNVMRIFGKDDFCELALADAGEFTGLPEIEEVHRFTLPADRIVHLLEWTVFSSAKELGRFAMNGVRAEIGNDMIRAIATDGRRLSLVEQPVDGMKASSLSVTIPTKAVQQFLRLLQGAKEEVTIVISNDKIALHSRQATIISRLLEGEFPRYQAVIPKEGKNTAECDTKQLIQKLRLVAHLCAAEQPVVRFKFASNTLTLTASSPQRGEARAELPVVFKGTTEEISFNPEYVIEGLKASLRETVRLEFNDRAAPGKFYLNENHEYIVMPVVNE
ncbi:MAG: DNA polymerase III subunit beta [Planctomycetota bacterium]